MVTLSIGGGVGSADDSPGDYVWVAAAAHLCYVVSTHGEGVRVAASLVDSISQPQTLLRAPDTEQGWDLVDTVKEHAVSQAVAAAMDEVLTELANMPGKVTNPETWLAELEREELGAAAERKQAPEQARGQAAKAQRLREKKTATMRKLRAEGRTA